MAKKTAAKKTASKKKRTAAQKRATEKLVAANKKKRASKKKASARTGSVSTGRRRSAAKVRGYPGGARRTNPKERYTKDSIRYVIRAIESSTGTIYFLGEDGSRTRDPLGAALFNRRDNAALLARDVDPKQYDPVHVAPIDIKMNKKQYEDLMS